MGHRWSLTWSRKRRQTIGHSLFADAVPRARSAAAGKGQAHGKGGHAGAQACQPTPYSLGATTRPQYHMPDGAAYKLRRRPAAAEGGQSMTKQDFLSNFRIARNLFVHPRVEADSSSVDPQVTAQRLARAAIWLTPKSVAAFNAADFQELGLDRQRDLQEAVREFLTVAGQVPADQPVTVEQYGNAATAFTKILQILEPYLTTPEEGTRVARALQSVQFPPWVVNWDYELGSDDEGKPAVWINLFADQSSASAKDYGRLASQIMQPIRRALSASGDTERGRSSMKQPSAPLAVVASPPSLLLSVWPLGLLFFGLGGDTAQPRPGSHTHGKGTQLDATALCTVGRRPVTAFTAASPLAARIAVLRLRRRYRAARPRVAPGPESGPGSIGRVRYPIELRSPCSPPGRIPSTAGRPQSLPPQTASREPPPSTSTRRLAAALAASCIQ